MQNMIDAQITKIRSYQIKNSIQHVVTFLKILLS